MIIESDCIHKNDHCTCKCAGDAWKGVIVQFFVREGDFLDPSATEIYSWCSNEIGSAKNTVIPNKGIVD